MNEGHCDQSARDRYGVTPIHYTCSWGRLEIAKYLVNEGHCDPNARNSYGSTPLHHAYNKEEVAQYLISEYHVVEVRRLLFSQSAM